MGLWSWQAVAAWRAAVLCLAVGLLVPAAGCSRQKAKSVEYAEVSGKVTYKGNPLPGGRVTFVHPDGFTGVGDIDDKGNYKVNAPIGADKIGVDNTMLQKAGGFMGRRGGGGPPAKMPTLKGDPTRQDQEQPHVPTGRYVNIPDKYHDPDQSGLTHTVVAGAQTHDIKLD
jgi:hypothetical protein